MTDRGLNAGVDAQTGFALQRNTALYLLFEHYYNKFKDRIYFICLEHHEDFLFCFLDDYNQVTTIEAYQSKKKSPDKWTINEMSEILKKILETGKQLLNDPIQKTNSYTQSLYFTTNNTISIDYEIIQNNVKKKKSIKVKEDNDAIAYNDLPIEAKSKIKKNINCPQLETELNNLNFLYIDLNRTVSKQKNELVGQIGTIFGKSIADKEGAVETLFSLFQDVEYIFNQGGKARLLDKTKRVSSDKINEALKVITTQSKAYDYWRENYKSIRQILKIQPHLDSDFKLIFTSAFDFFKDIQNAEHKKILKFVDTTFLQCLGFQEEEIVSELYDKFKSTHNSAYNDLELKAIIYAAYFAVTNKKEPIL